VNQNIGQSSRPQRPTIDDIYLGLLATATTLRPQRTLSASQHGRLNLGDQAVTGLTQTGCAHPPGKPIGLTIAPATAPRWWRLDLRPPEQRGPSARGDDPGWAQRH
jgi:hypothetical protein